MNALSSLMIIAALAVASPSLQHDSNFVVSVEATDPTTIYPGICERYSAFDGTVPDTSLVDGKPFFSWDHVPLFWHAGNMNGLSEEEIDYIANRPFATITLEKYDSIYTSIPASQQEDKLTATANKIKAKNPKAQVLFFQNSLVSFPNYNYHCTLKSNNWLLKSTDGAYIPFTYTTKYPYGTCKNDGGIKMTRTLNVYDYRSDQMLQGWKERISSIANGDVFSGFFVDRVIFGNSDLDKGDKWKGLLSPGDINKWFNNFGKAVSHIGDAVYAKNKIVLGNNFNFNYTNAVNGRKFGRMYEIFMIGPNQLDISPYDQVMDFISNAKQRLVHVHSDSCNTPTYPQTLAGFLIGACKNTYYMCSNRFEISSTNKSPLCWKGEYNKKLGKPLGAAKIKGTTTNIRMFRQFESGTKVYLFFQNNKLTSEIKSCICWADGTGTCYNANCNSIAADFKTNFPATNNNNWVDDGCAA